MQKVFLSYSSQDKQAVDQLAKELSQQGISYWRDQEKLYAGQRWPKELGDAIAAQDRLLLIWSKNAANSDYVQMEWCTAIALRKPVLPCRLDDTPLPNALCSLHSADLRNPPEALSQIHCSLSEKVTAHDLTHYAEVVDQLAQITSGNPGKVLQKAKTVFNQRGWVVLGNVYNAPVYYITTTESGRITPERRHELTLLRRVQQDWIEGVLNASLGRRVQLMLNKAWCQDLVDHPLEQVIDVSTARDHVPLNTSMASVYDQAAGFLLVLGEPGCGKTISLLELASSLISRAFADPMHAIPVVFNLSTWGKPKQSLADWLVDELQTKYQVGRRVSTSWVKENRLVLLLDGLDEAKPAYRAMCVQAINYFVEENGAAGIAVCSRSAEYESLPSRLRFRGAVKLLPLTGEQIDQFLAEGGTNLAKLRSLVSSDDSMRALAQSPLMLSIMSMTYQGPPESRIMESDECHPDPSADRLMSLYIERMFRRKGAGDSPFDRHEVLAGLSWIAQQAKNHSQILMHIEGLQPSWIGNIRWNWSYWIGSRCISTFIIALLTAWSFLPPLEGETYISLGQVGYWCMYWALIGVAGGILDGLEGSKTLPMSPPWDRAIKFRRILTYVLLSVFYFTIGTSFTIANSKGTWSNIAAGSIILGGLYGLLDHARSRKRTRDADIHTFEGWTWSWPHAWNGYVQGYAWGILSSAIFCTSMAIIAVCELYMVLTGSMSLETYPLLSVSVLWWSLLALSLLSMLMGLTIWILCFRHPDKGKGRKISYWLMGKWTSTDWVTVPRQKELWIMLGIAEVTCGLTFLVLYYFPPRLDSATTIEFYRNFIQAVFVIAGVLPLVLGLFPAFIKGIRTGTVDLKIKPNQGILLSARNSLVVGAIAWLVICIIDILVLTITNKPTFENVLYDLRKSLFLALLLCAWYGRDVIHHYVLRLVLWAGGYTPLRLVRFLNQGVTLVFLQKVGGGYIFIHRLVMEHFASLKEPSPEHLPNAAAAVHAQERVNS